MASSLRSRLWLSYAAVILVALFVVAVGLVIALRSNPILYRQAVTRIFLAGSAISFRLDQVPLLTENRENNILQREAEARNLRLAVIEKDGSVVLDVGPGSENPLARLALPLAPTEEESNLGKILRDVKGANWLYTLHKLENQKYLMVATPQPVLRPRDIFRDEILGPFFQAALIALLLGLGLSLLIGQWIANPLKQMAGAARKMENGNYSPIPLDGPREVQQLGEALNEMAHKVQTSQQSQREFLANVSHELKTPLTSIQGFSQAILDGAVQTPDALKQAAGVIYQESNRMFRLVVDLLSLARLEAGTADLQRMPLDLAALLRSILEKFSIQAQKAKVNLNVDLAPSLVIIGDGDRLSQVFTNLVDNALKFTPENGQVTVRASQQGDSAIASVIDTGIGIEPQDQTRIFERFYQVDKSRKGGVGRGVGLGLAIAAQIIAAHGGRIWVNSQPGLGTTFAISIPLSRLDDQTLDIRPGAL
jgi:two-component system OmpR family sensor kinase